MAGGEEGAGVGDERIAFREMHGLSKKRDSETCSEVLGIKQGVRKNWEGLCVFPCSDKKTFVDGLESDGKKCNECPSGKSKTKKG